MSFAMVELGEVCKVVSGATPKREVPAYWKGDIDWVTPKDLTDLDSKYIDEAPEKISEAGYKSCSTHLVPAGSVLLSSRAPIGHLAITKRSLCTNQGFKNFVPGPKVDAEYLYWALKRDVPKLQAMGTGSTFKEISKAQIEKYRIPLPPLPTQRRIAAVLDKAQALVANDKRTLALYDQLARSLFLEMFGDPVRNERGWEVVKVSEIATSRLGKMLDAKKQTGQHLRRYLRNTNVQWRNIQVHDLHEMDFDPEDREEFRLERGDILMCEGGEVGRCAIWEDQVDECYFQKALHRIRLDKSKVQPEYFVQLFIELVERNGLKDYTSTSTIAHLTGQKLATVRIPLPPSKTQRTFDERLAVIHSQRASAEQSLRQSEALLGSLLQGAFRGD